MGKKVIGQVYGFKTAYRYPNTQLSGFVHLVFYHMLNRLTAKRFRIGTGLEAISN